MFLIYQPAPMPMINTEVYMSLIRPNKQTYKGKQKKQTNKNKNPKQVNFKVGGTHFVLALKITAFHFLIAFRRKK